MENRCVVCGNIIPEGIIVCVQCENKMLNRKDFYMVEFIVNIDTIDKVKEFCNLCSKCADNVLVYSGRYIVSGKSIMGLFSLDLTKPLKVELYGDIPCEVRAGMQKFIVG